MKKLAVVLVIGLISAGLLAIGCKDKKSDETTGEAKTSEKVGAAAGQKDVDEVDEEVTDQVANAVEAVDEALDEDAAEAIAAAAELAKSVDVSKAPDYVKDMVEHLKKITAILKENMPDCIKAAQAASDYVEKNKAKIEKFSKQLEEAQKNLAPPEAAKLAQQVTALLMPAMTEMQKIITEFARECPKRAADVAGILKGVNP